ncbi:MAG: V-type ATP synthase subunit D [Euryarchaeota archaeon]|nr:V-type ATP synthase subunit D [Euryarchaeota archaeon]
MAKVIEGVKPTRMQLLEIKRKKELAKNGHKLLSEKRDALISEFFKIIDIRNELRAKVERELNEAFGKVIEVEMIMGKTNVEDISHQILPLGDIRTTTMNIMGVLTPQMELVSEGDRLNYGFLNTSAKLDEAVMKFSSIMRDLVKLAEVEGTIEDIAREIEKTKRRVNALEHIFIPRFEATEKYIELALSEREREDFFRRKRIKSILAARANAEEN